MKKLIIALLMVVSVSGFAGTVISEGVANGEQGTVLGEQGTLTGEQGTSVFNHYLDEI